MENKRLCKGTLSDSSGTLYTVPTNKKTIVKAVTITNKTNTDQVFTLKFAEQEIVYEHTILANDTITIPFIDQILETGETIKGHANATSAVNYYISGKEIDIS